MEALAVERFDWAEAAVACPPGHKVVTISPAYNEAENVGAVLEAMPKRRRRLPRRARSWSTTIPTTAPPRRLVWPARSRRALPIRRGGGLALRVGYDIALRLGADIVVSLDADGQHLPEELPALIEPIVDDVADHVNGSRILGDFERGSLPPPHSACTSSRARHDPDRSARHRHLQRISGHARRDPAQAHPGAGPVLDLGGHDRGAASACSRRRGPGDLPHQARWRIQEAEDVPLRMALLQSDRQDLAAVGLAQVTRDSGLGWRAISRPAIAPGIVMPTT